GAPLPSVRVPTQPAPGHEGHGHDGHDHPPAGDDAQPRVVQPPRPGPSQGELQRLEELHRRLGVPPVLRPAPQPAPPQNP
ncbi:MAG: hypothetical protein ACK4N5_20525, partial [Myxococcales bacterium]